MMSNFAHHRPGVACVKQTTNATVSGSRRLCLHPGNPNGDEVSLIHSISNDDPSPDTDGPGANDYDRFARFAHSQAGTSQRIWKGLYGVTTDDNNFDKLPLSLFVPHESYIGQITLDVPGGDPGLTQGTPCLAGSLSMPEGVHRELQSQAWDEYGVPQGSFSSILDVSQASLGDQRPLEYSPPRQSHFLTQQEYSQSQDLTNTGFRSVGNPQVSFDEETHEWTMKGPVETVLPAFEGSA
ncbi:hypothetical protein I302_105803 [Kwoniella bestiolae CBS 10118]|uniref:Uncharacterized protein n=1 Tax=Kwoniella bestiolae CBS 10118 TaxID=1296100 RepID=A0A1B9G270_9TREE|nr:hypothetical protein I302_04924 [Kwoniella bestiolae CBS 10118]OCF25114.1 hypothetical protein I302_04924 [Kwoniella bestiolae CBS 10118]